MTIRPADLELARARARRIHDPARRDLIERVLKAAYRGDPMAMVDILIGPEPEEKPEPWLEMGSELFGNVPAEGFEDLPRDEELGASPEVLEFPEDVLKPIDEGPPPRDLGLELVIED